MTLPAQLEEIARAHASKPAVVGTDSALTYQQLWDRSLDAAARFAELGVGPGERVALVAESSPQLVVGFWAAQHLGALPVLLNASLGPSALTEILQDCEPRLTVASRRTAETRRDCPALAERLVLMEEIFNEHDGACARMSAFVDENAPATIVYTSGSTGAAKGVCLSHRNLLTVVQAVITQTPLSSDDGYLMLVPLHYVHGLMQMLAHLLAGATLHLAPTFVFAGETVDRLASTRATGVSGTPFHIAGLIQRSDFLTRELPHLRWLTVTGGRSDPSHLLAIHTAKPSLRIFVAYGQTECAPRATLLDPARVSSKPRSVGSPIPGVEVLLLDDSGRPVPTGEVGAVVVRGPNVMLGYWRDTERTRQVVDHDGRLHTGDYGYLDTEGDLFLVGRRDDMIKCAGERVFPGEVERVLLCAACVADALVLGEEDAVRGTRLVAHLQLHEFPKTREAAVILLAEVEALARRELPSARVPRQYVVWEELPRKENGKVDRQRIAAPGGDAAIWVCDALRPAGGSGR